MTITAAKQYSFEFNADGTSSAFVYDLSLLPLAIDFSGALPTGVVLPSVTNSQGVTVPAFTLTVAGSKLTFTFATPPPQLDSSSVLVAYTAQFTLQFP